VPGSAGSASSGDALTFDGLKIEWESKSAEVEAFESEAEKLRVVIVDIARRGASQLDDLDAYMLSSQSKEAEISLNRLMVDIDAGKAVLRRLGKLMKVAAPALTSLHTKGKSKSGEADTSTPVIAKASTDPSPEQPSTDEDGFLSRSMFRDRVLLNGQVSATHHEVASRPSAPASNIDLEDGRAPAHSITRKGEEDIPPPETRIPRSISSTASDISGTNISMPENKDIAVPASQRGGSPHKKRAVSGPSLRPSETSTTLSEVISVSSCSQRISCSGTAAIVAVPAAAPNKNLPRSHPTHLADKKNPKKVKQQPAAALTTNAKAGSDLAKSANFKSDTLEGGDAVWCPPKNQTGDGKTSLNAKYGY
jgi:hypothetical protein